MFRSVSFIVQDRCVNGRYKTIRHFMVAAVLLYVTTVISTLFESTTMPVKPPESFDFTKPEHWPMWQAFPALLLCIQVG